MKRHKFFLVLFLLFFINTEKVYPQFNSSDYITEETIFALYAKGDKLYKLFSDQLVQALKSKNTSEQKQAIEAYQNLASLDKESNGNQSPDEIVNKIEDWNKNGYFFPNGLIKFANYENGSNYLSFSAKIDLNQFYEASKSYAEKNSLTISKDSNSISLKSKNGIETIITDKEIKQGQIPEKSQPAKNSWDIFNYIENESTLLAAELNFDLINKQEQNSKDNIEWIESNVFIKSLHPIYRDLSKLVLVIKADQSKLILSYKDEETRLDHKNILQNILKYYDEAAKKVLEKAKEQNSDIKLNLSLKIIDNSPWLGVETDNIFDLRNYALLFPMVMVSEQETFKKMKKVIIDCGYNITLNRENVKPIGWRKLFEKKNIKADENIINAMKSIDILGDEYKEYERNFEDKPNPNKLEDYVKQIKTFDDNMPWSFLKQFEWDEEKELFQREDKIVFSVPFRQGLGNFIAEITREYKKQYPDKDCSFALSAILKLFIIFEYSSSTPMGYYFATNTLSYCFYFYDGVLDGLFSKEEMKRMLEVLNNYEKTTRSFIDIIKADYNNYYTEILTNSYRNVPISAIYMHFKAGSPYLVDEKAIKEFEKGDYNKGDRITEEYFSTKNVYAYDGMLYAENIVKIKYKAYMALLKAWIEHKLELPITAKDPYTGETIAYVEGKDEKPGYFYSNDYRKGKITYFSSYGSKEEKAEFEKNRKAHRAKRREGKK